MYEQYEAEHAAPLSNLCGSLIQRCVHPPGGAIRVPELLVDYSEDVGLTWIMGLFWLPALESLSENLNHQQELTYNSQR